MIPRYSRPEMVAIWSPETRSLAPFATSQGLLSGSRDESSFDFFGEQVIALAEVARDAVERSA